MSSTHEPPGDSMPFCGFCGEGTGLAPDPRVSLLEYDQAHYPPARSPTHPPEFLTGAENDPLLPSNALKGKGQYVPHALSRI